MTQRLKKVFSSLRNNTFSVVSLGVSYRVVYSFKIWRKKICVLRQRIEPAAECASPENLKAVCSHFAKVNLQIRLFVCSVDELVFFSRSLQRWWNGEGQKSKETHGAFQWGGERTKGGQTGDGQTSPRVCLCHRRTNSQDQGESVLKTSMVEAPLSLPDTGVLQSWLPSSTYYLTDLHKVNIFNHLIMKI